MKQPSDIMIEKEWTRGEVFLYSNKKIVGLCFMGAVRIAYPGKEGRKTREHYYDAVRSFLGTTLLAHWNDHIAESKEQVVALMRAIEERIGLRPLKTEEVRGERRFQETLGDDDDN